MPRHRQFLLSSVLFLFAAFTATAATVSLRSGSPITLSSPDANIRFSFLITDSFPVYNVWYGQTSLIASSPLYLVFRETGHAGEKYRFGPALRILRPVYREGEDTYSLPVGRNSMVHDRYNEYTIPLEETHAPQRQIVLVVRLYNDGVAFHWAFPRQPHWSHFQLMEENTGFRLAGDPTVLASFLPGYTTSHEGLYTRLPFSAVKEDTLMDTPIFLQWPGAFSNIASPNRSASPDRSAGPNRSGTLYMNITEARLTDYAGMYLVKHHGLLQSELSPLPDGNGIRVIGDLPHRTPWRVLLIGPRPGAFLESNLLTDLNDPCAIKDLSWLKPGKTDFHWWNGDVVPDTTFQPGINFETNQYYIDFCARNHIEYHTVIGYGGIAWYTNDGVSYDAGPHSDPSKPLPGLDMQRICAYAASKGVGIRVWVHWKALWPPETRPTSRPSGQTLAPRGNAVDFLNAFSAHIDKTFATFEKWGIKGMMVDFMDRDDQQMVNIQAAILRKAALHHLHIQFHGAYKPTGLIRTWPNELTREGTLNYENDKWGDPITPDDDLNVVFTRLVAGPTDYHLGGFRAVNPEDYKAHFVRPFVLGTRCHMLAMYIVLESYLPMVCDDPIAYEGQPGFDFIQHVPSTWDETRVPVAIPYRWVSIARRKGQDWFVGTINSGTARDTILPLSFLPAGRYEATIYSDALTHDPNRLTKQTHIVRSTDTIPLSLAAGGGQAVWLRKLP
jgi:alpha-glucosidase